MLSPTNGRFSRAMTRCDDIQKDDLGDPTATRRALARAAMLLKANTGRTQARTVQSLVHDGHFTEAPGKQGPVSKQRAKEILSGLAEGLRLR